jgi:hypothetical protein
VKSSGVDCSNGQIGTWLQSQILACHWISSIKSKPTQTQAFPFPLYIYILYIQAVKSSEIWGYWGVYYWPPGDAPDLGNCPVETTESLPLASTWQLQGLGPFQWLAARLHVGCEMITCIGRYGDMPKCANHFCLNWFWTHAHSDFRQLYIIYIL